MANRWVINASPVITLCKVGQQGLFLQLSDQVVLPRAVLERDRQVVEWLQTVDDQRMIQG